MDTVRRRPCAEKHAARLRAVFEHALFVAISTAPPVLTISCSSASGGNAASTDAAAADVFVRGDARAGTDASLDGGHDSADALWAPGCEPGPHEPLDAGGDASSPSCDYGVPLPCGLPSWVTGVVAPECLLYQPDCRVICGRPSGCKVANGFGCDDEAGAFVAPDGSPILIECDLCPGAGRRPAGLVPPPARRTADPVGGFLAHSAFLEAASVAAFRGMALELRGFGAPRALVEAATRCARDELRHARMMTRLARARGCEPARPRVVRTPRRSLLNTAIENQREGCVRETFGALVATWQAAHARDRRLASAMARIAADETRHAALSWAVADWMAQRLDRHELRRVADARRDSASALKAELRTRPSAALVREAGFPTCAAALSLHEQLRAALWT